MSPRQGMENMSSEERAETNRLNDEESYNGMVYWLNLQPGYGLSLPNLRDRIDGHTFQSNITDDVDEAVHVPEIFKNNGKVVSQTSVPRTEMASSEEGNILIADVEIDESKTFRYRDNKVLRLKSTDAKIMFLEQSGYFYLIVLGARDVAKDIAEVLQRELDVIGSLLNRVRLDDDAMKKIREDLDAKLLNTIIDNYPQPELSNVQIRGQGFEEEQEYQRNSQIGRIINYMLQTKELTGDKTTLEISNDGLVRTRSKIPLSVFVRLLREYVLPRVHRDDESSPNLSSWEQISEDDPLFVQNGEER